MIYHRVVFSMPTALALTIAFEAVMAPVFAVRSWFGQGIVLFSSIITNPLLNAALTVAVILLIVKRKKKPEYQALCLMIYCRSTFLDSTATGLFCF